MDENSKKSSLIDDVFNVPSLIKLSIIVITYILVILLGPRWIRPVHMISGFVWWGMVFFINFIIIPVFPKLSSTTQFEILGNVFPRIFRTATIFGFFTVGLGWFFALDEYANWDLSYFTHSLVNILFLIGITAVTLLYLFHLFLERSEINLIAKIATGKIKYEDERVQSLIAHLMRIPRIGFIIQSTAIVLMFVH